MKRIALILVLLLSLIFLFISSCSKKSTNTTGPDNPKTYSVSGRILENDTCLSGVSIHVKSASLDTTLTTTYDGTFFISSLVNGIYTLTPSKTDYAFNPANPQMIVNGTSFTVPDLTATKLTTPPPVTIQSINFVSIPGDTFQMGLTNVFEPVHSVTVSSFQMSEAEITNDQYCTWLNAALVSGDIVATSSIVTGKKGTWNGQNYIYLSDNYDENNGCWITFSKNEFSVVSGHETWPVVSVTWYGAKAFAEYYGWDLPREAEWEYACRGGKQYLYGTDDGTISKDKANYYWGSGYIIHPVNIKSYPKNPFGLYDMSGNVWEWCNDWYGDYSSLPATNPTGGQTGSYHVIRGGGWRDDGGVSRSAIRGIITASRSIDIGFRVVRR
jgi:formylglycine-generating enzyme required for sulfatase activity